MPLIQTPLFQNKSPQETYRPKPGFALVITLSLMILLTVIAVGLLTLSSISLRSQAGRSGATAFYHSRNAGFRPTHGDCPFKPSASFTGVAFTGRHAEYTGADTWYPSWASDGNLYSPWTDGEVNGMAIGSGGDGAATGHATITGDDPLKLTVTDQGCGIDILHPVESLHARVETTKTPVHDT